MSDLLAEMEADFEEASATAVEKVNQEGLGSVAEIARAIRVKEDQIAALEDQLKESKKELLKLTDEDLPAMLQELGLSSFSLDDGSTVEVKPT